MKPQTKNSSVCIFGASLDVSNQGCRALAVSLAQLITQNASNARLFYLYGHHSPGIKVIPINGRDITIQVLNSRMSPKSKPNQHLLWILSMAVLYRILPLRPIQKLIAKSTPWIDALDKADFIGDIRGGDSFSDIYGVQRIFWGSIPSFITILMKKKLVLFPQTYGPYKLWVSRIIARHIFRHSDKIFARDLDSISMVKSILGKQSSKKHIEFCPDVAFVLEPRKPLSIHIEPALENPETKTIGLNISGLLFRGGYTGNNMFNLNFDYRSFIIKLIEQIMEKTDAHVLLVPHVFSKGIESDFSACLETAAHFGDNYQGRLHRVTNYYDQNEIKYIIGTCDFFAGSRMHACIAALSQGIPAIGLAYSKKFIGVFDSVKLGEYVLDIRSLDQDKVIENCLKLYHNREKAQAVLSNAITTIKAEVNNCFHDRILEIH